VVGIDVSAASLQHEERLKQKHNLRNLELHRLSLDQTASLGKTFDLIVCSGVLHHLPDPDAALGSLREVLEPHGVISLMVYGHYPRVGVHMLQEAFRTLGVQQDAAGIEMVKHALDEVLPPWHHIHAYKDGERWFDAGLVDTYLHPRERAYTVPEILEFVSGNHLKFQGWLDNLDYSISIHIPNPQDPLRRWIETLPASDQWRLVELIGQNLRKHFVLACRADRPESDYTLDFTGQDWLDYVPSIRPPMAILNGQPSEANEGRGSTTTSLKRLGHRIELDPLEAAILMGVDGKRQIIEIIEDDALDELDALRRVQRAREFFQRMAGWDHLQYEIP
jgi:SAM-dependent methyltransferase